MDGIAGYRVPIYGPQKLQEFDLDKEHRRPRPCPDCRAPNTYIYKDRWECKACGWTQPIGGKEDMKKTVFTEEVMEKMRQMDQEGLSARQIAEKLGLKSGSVSVKLVALRKEAQVKAEPAQDAMGGGAQKQEPQEPVLPEYLVAISDLHRAGFRLVSYSADVGLYCVEKIKGR